MSVMSETWDRWALRQVGLPSAVYSSARVVREWREHIINTRGLTPLQQFDVRVQRDVSVPRLAATTDGDQSLTLDALSVVTVFSEHFMSTVAANESVLVRNVYDCHGPVYPGPGDASAWRRRP